VFFDACIAPAVPGARCVARIDCDLRKLTNKGKLTTQVPAALGESMSDFFSAALAQQEESPTRKLDHAKSKGSVQ
jgi:hypothetical protein